MDNHSDLKKSNDIHMIYKNNICYIHIAKKLAIDISYSLTLQASTFEEMTENS